jgi:hypothetical protein
MSSKTRLAVQIAATLALGLSTTAQATLMDRGNGMIYDSDQDITWLQDANYAKTSGYDDDGRMYWDEAMAWVDGLIYGGYDDWRLPTTTPTNEQGAGEWSNDGTDAGYNVDTSTSEMAYMFHDILGNGSWFNTDGTRNYDGCPDEEPHCVQNTSADGVDILNLEHSAHYWSSTEYAIYPDSMAWAFSPGSGGQGAYYKDKYDIFSSYFAWAVRDGDVAAASVPEPGSLMLMMAGLAGLGFVKRRA